MTIICAAGTKLEWKKPCPKCGAGAAETCPVAYQNAMDEMTAQQATISRLTEERDGLANPTDAMLDAWLKATGAFCEPWEDEYEEGTLVSPGMDAEQAEIINKDQRAELRAGWLAAVEALATAPLPDAQFGGGAVKFQMGQEVWMASFEPSETWVTCPDCAGTGRLRVLFADDTMVSIECRNCGLGYDPPSGRVKLYTREASAKPVTITGVELREGKTPEWRTHTYYIVEEDNLFLTETEAVERGKALAAKHDEDDRRRVLCKEKDTRTWAWNASYHRREIKEAQKRIEYHTAKLAVANLKAKQGKTTPRVSSDDGARQ